MIYIELFFAAFGLVLLSLVYDVLRELLRTFRRIEARLTLIRPLESEEKPISKEFLLRRKIEERATQPDIWSHLMVEERTGLEGEEFSKKLRIQRYTEKTRRN